MTASQIAVFYFEGKKEAAKKRLQKLKAAGLIGERRRRVNEKSVLSLTRKGHVLLQEEKLLASFPKLSQAAFEKRASVSELTLQHELEVLDVKAAFYSALRKSETFTIAEFSTWPRLHEFKASPPGIGSDDVLVKPDGFIRIQEKEKDGGLSEHTFFLEVDRSNETQGTLVRRAACYLDYYKSGGFAARNGARRSDYKKFPFRVLIVLKNAERRNNTAERLEGSNPPILTLAYLSTFPEVLTDPVGPVWIRPVDYREVVAGSVLGRQTRTRVYRRSQARETLVEQVIKRMTLLE
jgi:Replication-relaxation